MSMSMSRTAPYVSFSVMGTRPGHRASASDIVAAVAREVKSGRMVAGCRLPPVRALENQLGVSKNTVQAAYDELVARGIVASREREGFFVRGDEAPVAPVSRGLEPPAPRLKPPAPLPGPVIPKDTINLSTVFVDPDLLPRDKLAECARSILRTPGLESFSDMQGCRPLREAIARRLCARGMEVVADHVIVTTGSQQALDIVARTLEVRRVATESPVYPHARLLFEGHGLHVTGLRIDPFDRIPFDEWEERIAATRPGLLYAITSFQNPTGYSYTTSELVRVIELARTHGFAVLEDDWGSDMLSGSEYRPSLRVLGGKNVLYANSFTKKLLPSLRVGFLVASEELVPSLVSAKRLSTLGHSWLVEAVVAEFLDRGYYDTHLDVLQRELDRRYEACLDALRDLMPSEVRWTTPGGGPTLWVDVPRSIDLADLRRRAATRGVQIEDASVAFHGERHLHGFRVSYAYSPVETLRHGLEIVGETLRAMGLT